MTGPYIYYIQPDPLLLFPKKGKNKAIGLS